MSLCACLHPYFWEFKGVSIECKSIPQGWRGRGRMIHPTIETGTLILKGLINSGLTLHIISILESDPSLFLQYIFHYLLIPCIYNSEVLLS